MRYSNSNYNANVIPNISMYKDIINEHIEDIIDSIDDIENSKINRKVKSYIEDIEFEIYNIKDILNNI